MVEAGFLRYPVGQVITQTVNARVNSAKRGTANATTVWQVQVSRAIYADAEDPFRVVQIPLVQLRIH